MSQRFAFALVPLLGGTASAQAIYAASPGRAAIAMSSDRHQVDGRVGMLLGGADVGDADGWSVGFAGGLGYRIGDVTLRGTFDYYRVGDGANEAQQRRGRASRFGGGLRYSFANTGADNTTAFDFWGEAGLGYEHVDWRQGGVLDRPSFELAIGFDMGVAAIAMLPASVAKRVTTWRFARRSRKRSNNLVRWPRAVARVMPRRRRRGPT